ncbi:MAG: GNAT family N-acetyltransferase [Phycisphaerales bacterium]
MSPEHNDSTRSSPPALGISLRHPTWDDVPALFEILSEPLGNQMAGIKPRTREAFFARWKDVLADPAINSRVIEIVTPGVEGGGARRELVGSINVIQVPGEARDNIGYWIAREHWGKGIASRALAMFLKEEPRRPLHATASMANPASHRVMLKNGFRLVGSHITAESDRLVARETGEFVLETGGHDLAQTLAVLERTPGVLDALLRGVPSEWTQHNYGERTWCAREVVGHLIVAERDDWVPRLTRIIECGETRPFDPFPHDSTVNTGVLLDELLDEFARLRQRSLREVAAMNLTPVVQCRTGIHPALGRVTVAQLLATWAVHDLHHLRQIALAMAWQYRDSVGPWREYLNTLAR